MQTPEHKVSYKKTSYPLYSALLWIGIPFIVLRLFIKSIKESGYRHHIKERFGYYDKSHYSDAWIHGVSVGELQAAYPLIEWLKETNVSVVITTTTPAGRKTAQALYGCFAQVVYLPYDLGECINRFFSKFQPKIGFILETELWPNLLAFSKINNLPLWLINGRLSERSFNRYLKISSVSKQMINSFTGIAVQTQLDADRFKKLGANSPVIVTGNLKFDRRPDLTQIAQGLTWRKMAGERKIIAIASTRAGEEAALLPTIDMLCAAGNLVVIIPRHPHRFNDVFKLLESKGFRCQRRSDNSTISAHTHVWIGDSLGEMTSYYAMADVAVIGGTWLPYGGQNPLEAMVVKTPAIVGPHTFHFSQIVKDASKAKALVQVNDINKLGSFLLLLLNSTPHYMSLQSSAINFIIGQRGAIDKIKKILKPILQQLRIGCFNSSTEINNNDTCPSFETKDITHLQLQ